MAKRKIKASPGARIFDIFNYTFLALFAISIIYPFWNLILQSFSRVEEVNSLGLHIWIKTWNIESYQYVYKNLPIGISYLNTLHRTIFGTLATLAVTVTAGYALSKRNLPGRNIFTMLFVFTMFFSGGLIPTYLVIKNLGLMNSRWVLILPMAMNVFYIIIARNFFMTIDQAMEDSAIIDGAGYMTVLIRIIIPLAKPVIATIALWTMVGHWNAWFDALIYIDEINKRVLQLLVREMLRLLEISELEGAVDELDITDIVPPQSVRAVTILITIGPIVIIYPFVQKYFVKGIMIGSLKG
jgi:putative aldouronate transport system permease protein